MSVGTLPSDDGVIAPVGGVVDLAFRRRDDTTVLGDLFQQAPMRVLFPRTTEPQVPVAVLLNTSGGLVGGDRLRVRVKAETGAAAVVTGQAAEKVYRSTGSDCRVRVDLVAQDGAWLEYLPQETILFEGARLERRTAVDASHGARVMAGDIVAFGRSASGEILTQGRIRDGWEVWREGRLVWADVLLMDGDLNHPLNARGCLNGAAALGTFLHVAPDAASQLPLAHELVERHTDDGLRGGATVVGDMLLVRWLGRDAKRLRSAFGTFWAAFRSRVAGREEALPRLWHV